MGTFLITVTRPASCSALVGCELRLLDTICPILTAEMNAFKPGCVMVAFKALKVDILEYHVTMRSILGQSFPSDNP